MLNWRAQLQTQQKLDALAAALVERPTPVVPPPVPGPATAPEPGTVPRELDKVSLPPYVIEPPDVLSIEVVVRDPKSGRTDRLPVQPISGQFQARPDGTVGLGYWGSVTVTGLTIGRAAEVIGAHLRAQEGLKQTGIRPENLKVIVDVIAYNSKRYYVIIDRAGTGEQVFSFPVTGSETVLDAVANVQGSAGAANKGSVRVARRTPNAAAPWQTLPVDWAAITQNGVTTTNYPLMPGDRVYVTRAAD
ncbi:MAG: polysaccharide biosynthesis/export family protein [Planctomycetes bacterium]|nr:polysaccharide biosynthesis/export family protein [Planctomycetota bacterium]